MKYTYSLVTLLLSISLNCFSQQKEVSLFLSHYYDGAEFTLDNHYTLDDTITCTISRLEYYLTINKLVSNSGEAIEYGGDFYTAENDLISYDGKQVFINTLKNKYSLGERNISDLITMEFNVGVAEDINHQDPTLWSSSHALAPKNPSMHWGWAAGYRFAAIEAMVDEDSDGLFESVLQYHAVGDILYMSQSLAINTVETEEEIIIYLDVHYDKLFTGINASNSGVFHGQQDQVVALMDNFAGNSVFTNSENLSLNSESLTNSLSPNPFTNSLKIELEKASKLKVYTILGDLLFETALNSGNSTIDTNWLKQGVYIFKLENELATRSFKLLKN